MTSPADFERRVASDLRRELDATDGPHPHWSGSPASSRIAARRGSRVDPGRLLAIAAALAVGGGALLWVGLRTDSPGGCLTVADYAAASAEPTSAFDKAPDVSFPPVAPDATPTTGMLKPGEWAVIADADGPGIQIRVRDVRECARLPDVRSRYAGGSLIVSTVDIRSLRPKAMLSWIGVETWVGMGLAGLSLGDASPLPPGYTVPGVSHHTSLELPADFAHSSTIIFDVPPSDAMVTADHPTFGGEALHPPHAPTVRDQNQEPVVSWLLRPGRETGGFEATRILPTPGASATTGDLTPGTSATVTAPDGDAVLTLTDVDQVERYPGREPTQGRVFVEARFMMVREEVLEHGSVANRWRFVDGDGNELPSLDPSPRDEIVNGVLDDILAGEFVDDLVDGWLVVEAPPTGLIRAELLRDGDPVPILTYVLREP